MNKTNKKLSKKTRNTRKKQNRAKKKNKSQTVMKKVKGGEPLTIAVLGTLATLLTKSFIVSGGIVGALKTIAIKEIGNPTTYMAAVGFFMKVWFIPIYNGRVRFNKFYDIMLVVLAKIEDPKAFEKESSDSTEILSKANTVLEKSKYLNSLEDDCKLNMTLPNTLKLYHTTKDSMNVFGLYSSYTVYKKKEKYQCCFVKVLKIYPIVDYGKSLYITKIFNIIADDYTKNRDLYLYIAMLDSDKKVDLISEIRKSIEQKYYIFSKDKWTKDIEYDNENVLEISKSFYNKQINIIKYLTELNNETLPDPKEVENKYSITDILEFVHKNSQKLLDSVVAAPEQTITKEFSLEHILVIMTLILDR